MRVNRDKANKVAHVVTDALASLEEVDFVEDRNTIRLHLMTPQGALLSADTYNRSFTAHGVIMVFFFLVPVVPAVLGNFCLPLMIGAKDLAFPRLNLLSWYLYMAGAMWTPGELKFALTAQARPHSAQ